MNRRWFFVIFIIYTCAAIKLILFKDHLGSVNYADYNRFISLRSNLHRTNLTPFNTISTIGYRQNSYFVIQNIVGNIVIFTPLGFLLPILFPSFMSIFKIVATGVAVSLAFETIQLVAVLGIFDVDDIILNTLGAAIGYLLFKQLMKVKYFKTVGL